MLLPKCWHFSWALLLGWLLASNWLSQQSFAKKYVALQGIAWRDKPQLNARSGSGVHKGTIVSAMGEKDGWVQVAAHSWLPLTVDGVTVLELQPNQDQEDEDSQLPDPDFADQDTHIGAAGDGERPKPAKKAEVDLRGGSNALDRAAVERHEASAHVIYNQENKVEKKEAEPEAARPVSDQRRKQLGRGDSSDSAHNEQSTLDHVDQAAASVKTKAGTPSLTDLHSLAAELHASIPKPPQRESSEEYRTLAASAERLRHQVSQLEAETEGLRATNDFLRRVAFNTTFAAALLECRVHLPQPALTELAEVNHELERQLSRQRSQYQDFLSRMEQRLLEGKAKAGETVGLCSGPEIANIVQTEHKNQALKAELHQCRTTLLEREATVLHP
eukprot:INCI211.1.p1 GENE.INCI211.1~~INCI211.1.p1  ORF type:complete len:388 (+),score=79.41 INCI211.1:106-1269(+)